MLLASESQMPLYVPLLLLAMLVASCAIFWALVRQWTLHGQQLALKEWAEANGLALRQPGALPEALGFLGEQATALVALVGKRETLVQVQTPGGQGQAGTRWNLLVRELETAWPTTGLRPVVHARSVLDHLHLHQMPTMLQSERFVVYAHGQRSARALAQSSAKALLAADVGLLLIGESLILDFSTRPFDPLELQRMVAMGEQVVAHLPRQ